MNDLSLFYRWEVCDREKLCQTTLGLQACSLHPPLIGWEGVRAGNFKYPRVYQWGIWAWRWRVTYSVSWREELDEDPGYWPSVWGTELLLPAPSPWTWALTIKLVWTNPYLLLNDTSLVAWGQRGGSDGPKRGTRDLLGWWKYSVSECGSGFMVHAPPNSSSCTLQMDCALNWNYTSVRVIKKVPVCVFRSRLSQSGPPSMGCMMRLTHNVRSPLPPFRGPLPPHQLWSLQEVPVLGLTFPIYNVGTKHLMNRVFRGINGYHPM